jgi:3-methylcrotonyl-CoA carboxylase alpha subunit
MGAIVARTIVLRDTAGEHRATVEDDGSVSVDAGRRIPTFIGPSGEVRVDDPPRLAWTAAGGETRWVFLDGEVFELEVQPEGRRRRGTGHQGSLSAPMPATVVRVDAAAGDIVRRGDALIILEAMKMELPVRAPADGTVKAVHCKSGDLVQAGVPLIEIE